ncbi:Uncharacterised protein [Mycobacterium tuberculosis]|nr:Uncharacterised protein [Mycobacterium tuberculosis]
MNCSSAAGVPLMMVCDGPLTVAMLNSSAHGIRSGSTRSALSRTDAMAPVPPKALSA